MARKNKFEFNFKAEKLAANILPTKRSVICAINFEKEKNHQTNANAINAVINDVISIWKKLPLPILDSKTVRDKVKKCYNEYLSLNYNLNKPSNIQRCLKFGVKTFALYKCDHKISVRSLIHFDSFLFIFLQSSTHVLFDICTCRCDNFKYCNCSVDRKVPEQMRKFSCDQRCVGNATAVN